MNDIYNENFAAGYKAGTKRSALYATVAGGVGVVVGVLLAPSINNLSNDDASKPTPIQAEGFPKGYHIENVNIPTRGTIIRVEKLPGEQYQKTVDSKTGMITFTGPFEYEIKPLNSAYPKDDLHTDMEGHSPYDKNSKYWTDVRNGKVTLHLDKESLEQRVKK